ncbi:hypothetical protein E1200_05515 [Actinomadura sp. GC306]|uniref:hypothetical protein n=1 Tax=Actinomadura sp. GC306 TaxID=2530367 RepID=UPI0010539D25|nr:hypothetical protein [Actinomadura sp. GC306]TDC70359.1 hypothetical protein E1200_05515 [Actinomadura sp. GC306]
MTGDLGSEAGRKRSRPSFLPPVDGYPPAAEDVWEPAPAAPAPGGRRGTVWIAATLAAAAVLLVSAFLPWAHAQIIVELFGRPIGRDLGSLAGIDADTTVVAVPVLAVAAIALAAWDLIGRDARIGALAAIPGTLALLVCGVFVVRLGDVRDNLPQSGLDFGYQISLRYGWYVAVVASLLVAAFSLARTVADRTSRPSQGRPEQYADQRYPDQQYPDQQYAEQRYAGQQYPAQQYPDQHHRPAEPDAGWPQEDQAWGRPAGDEPSGGPGEPKRDQS